MKFNLTHRLQTGAKKYSINETFGGHVVFYVVYLSLSSLACFGPYFHFKHAIFRHKSHIAPREWPGSLHIL